MDQREVCKICEKETRIQRGGKRRGERRRKGKRREEEVLNDLLANRRILMATKITEIIYSHVQTQGNPFWSRFAEPEPFNGHPEKISSRKSENICHMPAAMSTPGGLKLWNTG